LNNGYNENLIPQDQRIALPIEGNDCYGKQFGKTCPSEDDWCRTDPSCSTTPYQEPSAAVNAGPIVAIVVSFFIVVLAVLFLVYKRRIAQLDRRNRVAFARR